MISDSYEEIHLNSVSLSAGLTISPFYLCWKKMVDIVLGCLGFLALLLLLPFLSLAIYIDSPGPVFYQQRRMGYCGKNFTVYKFRSMRTDAETAGRAIWATDHDARITRIGRFMRATHLDEFPQVFNILRGDMSLIGPRPERVEYAIALAKAEPLYTRRLLVKPGLTGWTQVQYGYGDSVEDELVKLNYDLYYIEHQSIVLDIKILLKTIVEVVLCHGK